MPRRSLIIFVGLCILLVSIIFLPSLIRHNLSSDTNKSNLSSDKQEGYTLYIIKNYGNINHEVTVELFNSKNTSIFNESYILAPNKQIESESSVGLADGTRIEVTLDNTTTENEFVLGNLSDVAVLYVDIDKYPDDPVNLTIAVP